MPQLSPLFWVFSSFMVVFLLVSMMVIFYVNGMNLNKIYGCNVYLMKWYW
uniref:ATP synthase F0 subunit 8 n=1 Tax=Austrarchaea platnickorum TaxID=1090236 RepID=H2E480_9ARAC|nr:ATP synthase F0 subunit 8 [Austrarchaea platnickorum]AEX88995.1 ATP synthase F0 subunit 8 [Austrarchaea platnickorum]AEX88998.1 ATP synthase F0 subunit 8 [Austrarchaea platnickorum]